MRHDPGLAASPPVRYTLKVERSGYAELINADDRAALTLTAMNLLRLRGARG